MPPATLILAHRHVAEFASIVADQKTFNHTVNLDPVLEHKIRHAMKLEGMTVFNEAARVAITRWCRQVFADHKIDPDTVAPSVIPAGGTKH